MSLLKVSGLTKHFGGIKAVQNVSFEMKKGEIVGLIGPNGSGKTTLFDLITTFYRPTAGRIYFEGKDITEHPPYMLAHEGVVRNFQMIRLFPQMTVLENLLVAETSLKGELLLEALVGGPHITEEHEKNLDKAIDLLEFVELYDKRNELAQNLSYGQQKLLEIARVLALDPKLLLLDEPDAGLNPIISKKVFNILEKVKHEQKSILLIEHDMDLVMSFCDRIIVLDAGEKIAEGSPKEIQENKKVIETYLGRVRK